MNAILKWLFSIIGLDISYIRNRPKYLDHSHDIQRLTKSNNICTIFDVGANIGDTVENYSSRFPSAKFFAFELISHTFNILRSRCVSISNTFIYKTAIGQQLSKVEVHYQDSNQHNSLSKDMNLPCPNMEQSEIVTVETINSFCKENNISSIDLLKIDTEGYELEVLKGASNLLKSASVKFIYIESSFSTSDLRHIPIYKTIKALSVYNYKFLCL